MQYVFGSIRSFLLLTFRIYGYVAASCPLEERFKWLPKLLELKVDDPWTILNVVFFNLGNISVLGKQEISRENDPFFIFILRLLEECERCIDSPSLISKNETLTCIYGCRAQANFFLDFSSQAQYWAQKSLERFLAGSTRVSIGIVLSVFYAIKVQKEDSFLKS